MSDFDINEPFNVWEDALNNERKRKQEWMNSLIRKYGFPVREENLLEKDYAMYDFLKDDLAKLEKSRLSYQPAPHGSSLDDEDMERNALRQRKQTEEDADVLKRIREEGQKQNTEYAEDRTENDSEIQQAKTTLADLGYYRGKIDNMATSGFTKEKL